MSEIPFVAGVLNPAITNAGGQPLLDSMLIARCEQCTRVLKLSEAAGGVTEGVRVYRCPQCSDLLAIVSKALGDGTQEPGLRVGDWVFSPVVDVLIEGTNKMFPAAGNALLALKQKP